MNALLFVIWLGAGLTLLSLLSIPGTSWVFDTWLETPVGSFWFRPLLWTHSLLSLASLPALLVMVLLRWSASQLGPRV